MLLSQPACRLRTRLSAMTVVAAAIVTARAGDHWPQWRGPALDGVSAARRPPAEWGDAKNILWKTELPAWAGSTPVVFGDRIFLTTPSRPEEDAPAAVGRRLGRGGGRETPGGRDLLLMCLSRADGRVLWSRKLDAGNKLFGKHNMASPSPVTDGRMVWVLTGTGVLVALDMEGGEKWRFDLGAAYGAFGQYWGYGSSPLLHEGRIIVAVMHGAATEAPSYLAAIDGATGKIVWHVERKTDAREECPDAYTTPIVVRRGGRAEIVISGADYVTGHDPETGREQWRVSGLNPQGRGNYRVCASPVAVGERIIAPTRVRPLLCLEPRGDGYEVAWRYDDGTGPDVPTPVSDGRRLYVVNDRGIVTCLDVRDGKVVWGPERTVVGTVSASPVLADGKLYVTNENCVTTVLSAGPEFRLLGSYELDGGYTLSTPVVLDGRVLLRSAKYLYCIGEGS
ncbi:MAG TPA: PQQ-binding-like beta-propeller repeat protein [Phycisphaerae bacterium]|nr:PQQ-binding-like beta-propeller repeat protein [Phycisphaerae bacterium]